MDQDTIPPSEAVAKALNRARAAFEQGEINAAWHHIAPLHGRILHPSQAYQRDFLTMGCGVYAVGDLVIANRLNATLPIRVGDLPMRYRLAVRRKQMRTAKWLRTSPEALATPDLIDDFKCSMAIYCVWNKRYSTGFALAPSRVKARLFPKIIPNSMRYAPLPKDPTDDLPRVILEQGVGDIILHVAHIKKQGHHETSTFIAAPQYRTLVNRWFPKATFVPVPGVPKELHGLPAHASADFMGRSWRDQRSFSIGDTQLDTPTRGPFDVPVIGICWRGGSGQIGGRNAISPLHYFLDMLPEDGRYMVLQFDLTDAERAILAQDRRITIPMADITEAPDRTLDMVRALAGMISVDSANWHFAGAAGVPIFAIMNKTAHWFWGPESKVEHTYPCATTVTKSDLSGPALGRWFKTTLKAWRARPRTPPAPVPATDDGFARPIFVASLPRVRSSMVMGALAGQGVWTGKTVAPTPENPKGFFENRTIRDRYVKGILKRLNADPLGVTKLPAPDGQPPYPALPYQLRRAIAGEGYRGGFGGLRTRN